MKPVPLVTISWYGSLLKIVPLAVVTLVAYVAAPTYIYICQPPSFVSRFHELHFDQMSNERYRQWYKDTKNDASIMRPSQEETNWENVYHPLTMKERSFLDLPKPGRGCHFFIYDSDVEWQGPAIAKTVSGIISSGGEGSRVRVDIVSTRSRRTMGTGIECLYVETLLPTQSSPTMISLKGPDRPHFRPDNAFLPNLFSP